MHSFVVVVVAVLLCQFLTRALPFLFAQKQFFFRVFCFVVCNVREERLRHNPNYVRDNYELFELMIGILHEIPGYIDITQGNNINDTEKRRRRWAHILLYTKTVCGFAKFEYSIEIVYYFFLWRFSMNADIIYLSRWELFQLAHRNWAIAQ